MKAGIKNFLTTVGMYLVPLTGIFALTLLLSVPRSTGFWNFLRFTPFYAGIYFWQSQRPDAFKLLSAFILGILADVLGGVPVGVNIMSFMVLYLVSAQLSAYFNIQKFLYSWLLFILATFLTFLFKSLTVSIFYRKLIPLNYLLFEFLLTIALYPLWARSYMWIERRFIHLEDRYEKI